MTSALAGLSFDSLKLIRGDAAYVPRARGRVLGRSPHQALAEPPPSPAAPEDRARPDEAGASQFKAGATERRREKLRHILDLARWAPSADNTQPWRFEIVADDQIAIHGHDTRREVLYDFDGHASQMAHGALLETLRLAATRFKLKADYRIRPDRPDEAPIYDVFLHPSTDREDPLVPFIETRSVQRRAMRSTPLLAAQKAALAAAAGDDYTLQFFESFADRMAVARLLWNSAYLRLTCPEAYPVHRSILKWNARYSTHRIPDQAVGVDPLTTKLMHWVMQRWERVDFFNRYLLGTIVPRVEMDFIPALACGAHILVRPKRRQAGLVDQLDAGMALQRLWLTATRLGFGLQPLLTPVIFRRYVQAGRKLSAQAAINAGAVDLARQFERLSSSQPDDDFAFFCRIGHSPLPRARSLRKGFAELMLD